MRAAAPALEPDMKKPRSGDLGFPVKRGGRDSPLRVLESRRPRSGPPGAWAPGDEPRNEVKRGGRDSNPRPPA